MKITTTKDGSICTLAIAGRIDTFTAPDMEKEVHVNLSDCDKMIFDMSGVEYISSAGLRIIVYTFREMEKKGGLVLRGMNKNVDAIITMTGFKKKLTVEP